MGEHGSSVESWQFDWAGNPLPPLTPDTPKPQDWSERVRQHWQDPNFNLLGEGTQVPSEQVAYWPDNRVLYSADTQYQYDSQGNRTQHIEHKGETQRYYYNQLNQLQRVDRYTADNRLIRSLYRYDPLGRRLIKQVEHYNLKDNQLHEAADTEVEFYGWDGDRLAFTQTADSQWHIIYEPESFTPLLQLQHATDAPISEQDKVLAEVMGSLQSTLNYLPAHEAYELARTVRERTVAQLKANEQWQTPELPEECYFYHCNHLGLPEALTNTNGEAVWAASYDAWGNIKAEHNPKNLHQPIRLPGQYHDKETDLYYNRHRYYDPKLGNYINQDPIGLASGEPNLMAYPRNPVQGMDPLGLELCCKKTKCPAFSGEGLSDISKEAMQEINKITNAGKALSVIVPGFDMMSAFISKDASGAVEALWNISSHDTENTVNAVRAIPKIIRGSIEKIAIMAEYDLEKTHGSREEIRFWRVIALGECSL